MSFIREYQISAVKKYDPEVGFQAPEASKKLMAPVLPVLGLSYEDVVQADPSYDYREETK